MRRGDFVIVGIIAGVVFLSLASLWALSPDIEEDHYVLIRVDGEEFKTIPLSEPQTLLIENEGGFNEIVIDSEGVYMDSASCDNQECVHQGRATTSNLAERILGGWIICLPNKVGVELIGGSSQ